jgi:hypothetical protein
LSAPSKVVDSYLDILLDMKAGAGGGEMISIDDDPIEEFSLGDNLGRTVDETLLASSIPNFVMEGDDAEDLDDDAKFSLWDADDETCVHPGNHLLELLKHEVERTSKEGFNFAREGSQFRCHLCPWRTFRWKSRVLHHISKYHSEENQYVASGTKQLKVITALYDHDATFAEEYKGKYLARSALLLRSTVKPGIDPNNNEVRNEIRMILDVTGPSFVNTDALQKNVHCRRCGNLYYTKSFAETLRTELLLSHAKMKPVISSMIRKAIEAGNPLASLYPAHVKSWWPIVEDIFFSGEVCKLEDRLRSALVRQSEMKYISIDATMRCCFSILDQQGQLSNRRKVLTVRGRTGAVLIIHPLRGDDTKSVVSFMETEWSEDIRNRVQYIGVDNPSRRMWTSFSTIFPHLEIIVLDLTHLPITYEYGFWRKRTHGSKMLRALMTKFTVVDFSKDFIYFFSTIVELLHLFALFIFVL